MSKRYSGKSFKDSSVMKKPKLSFKEKRKIKREKGGIKIGIKRRMIKQRKRLHHRRFVVHQY